MIIPENTTTVEQSGTKSSKTFGMQQSRKAFSILSDLYSDKPLAIVRELGCNAYDSHTQAGKQDVPFLIHLPNSLEPWITIQDFGTGISHENIYDIYAVYFSSTKTNTNSQIGCLGLGSKSPFCYTDNFTITSIHNGEKRVYNAYFNEEHLPTIAMMGGVTKTTESNGVAIQIPVKSQDFQLFKNAVQRAFKFFDVKPDIVGDTIEWFDGNVMFSGNDWKSYSNFNYGESYAIMGGVTYPIDRQKLTEKNSNFISKTGLVIWFNVGELDFTPSREQLSYCDQTVNNLNHKLDKIRETFVERFNEELLRKTNMFDAIYAVKKFNDDFFYMLGTNHSNSFIWGGYDITKPETFIRGIVGNKTMRFSYTDHRRKKFSESYYFQIENIRDGSNLWMFDDLTRGGVRRVKAYLKNNATRIHSITVFQKSEYDQMISFGFSPDDFGKTSDLPKPEYNKNFSGGNSSGIVKPIKVYYMGYCWQKSWDVKELDLNNLPACYIKKSNNFDIYIKILDDKNQKKIYIDQKGSLSDALKCIGLNDDDIVMVSDKNAKLLDGLGVPNFENLIREFEYVVDYRFNYYYQNCGSNLITNAIDFYESLKNLGDDNEMIDYLKKVIDFSKYIEHISVTQKVPKGWFYGTPIVSDEPDATKQEMEYIFNWQPAKAEFVSIFEDLKTSNCYQLKCKIDWMKKYYNLAKNI